MPPHCERMGRRIINSIEPAICRAQTNPGSKAQDKHHGTQHLARDASLRGRASRMTGLRCTGSARRAGRGGSTTVLRPARAQPSSLGLSSTGPSSLPPSPARSPRHRSVPAQILLPARWKEKGRPLLSSRGSRASRRASPAGHASGSLRSPRFSRARRSSSRGPQPLVPGAERLGRASQPGPRLGGRAAIELRGCTNTTGLSCTRSCGRAVAGRAEAGSGSPRTRSRRPAGRRSWPPEAQHVQSCSHRLHDRPGSPR